MAFVAGWFDARRTFETHSQIWHECFLFSEKGSAWDKIEIFKYPTKCINLLIDMEQGSKGSEDPESSNGEWVDVAKENGVALPVHDDTEIGHKTESKVAMPPENNNDNCSVPETSQKSTSTVSLQTSIEIPEKQPAKDRSLVICDKWLKAIVFVGAVIAVTTIVIILIEDSKEV